MFQRRVTQRSLRKRSRACTEICSSGRWAIWRRLCAGWCGLYWKGRSRGREKDKGEIRVGGYCWQWESWRIKTYGWWACWTTWSGREWTSTCFGAVITMWTDHLCRLPQFLNYIKAMINWKVNKISAWQLLKCTIMLFNKVWGSGMVMSLLLWDSDNELCRL